MCYNDNVGQKKRVTSLNPRSKKMAKLSVVVRDKDGNYLPQATLEKINDIMDEITKQVGEVTGIKVVGESTLAANFATVDPSHKATLKGHRSFLESAFMADKKLSNTGRAAKADLVKLESEYMEYMASHEKIVNVGNAMMNIAIAYNQKNNVPEADQIDGTYVANQVKKGGWANIVKTPAAS